MDHRNKTIRLALISLGIFIFAVLTKLIGLGKFMSVDEPAWLLFASNFFLALNRGQFEKTVYDYHPAVTTLWILSLAFLSYFPGYRLVGKFTDKYWQVDRLFQQYHKLPLRLLVHGRVISILAISGLLVVSFLLVNMLAGLLTALVVTGMVALDPYVLGHSRLLNHEMIMAMSILVSLLAALVYQYQRRQARYLLISGAAAGAALLTKSPAIVLLPLVGLIFLVGFLQESRATPGKGQRLSRSIGSYLLWLGVLSLVYFLLWPGMWVEPGKMLSAVFGNALSYTFQGQRLSVTQGLNPERFSLEFGGISQYLKVVLIKTTPTVWFGLALAILGLWVKKVKPMAAICRLMVVYFGLLALMFVLMFGIAQGRNHNHYILTTFVALDVIAGIGIAWGVGWLAERFHFAHKRFALAALLVLILALHAAGALPQYPYYYTYTNPLAGSLRGGFQDPDAGYGEGLELAGAYLAAKPGAKDLKAMSWFAAGPFSYYFPGTTYNLLISERVESDYVERMKESDYLVIYIIQQKAVNMPEKLLKALQPIPPEKVVRLNGQEYVQIYNVDDFSEPFFDSIRD